MLGALPMLYFYLVSHRPMAHDNLMTGPPLQSVGQWPLQK